jgi:hypothetical protein
MAESYSSPLITIPLEIEAEMTPAVKAFVLAAFAQFEARIAALEKQVRELSAKTPKAKPNNSSVSLSTVHPHIGVRLPRRSDGSKICLPARSIARSNLCAKNCRRIVPGQNNNPVRGRLPPKPAIGK